jgi:hypothetical protein
LDKSAKLRLFLVFILIGFIVAPAFADEQTIELSPEIPYVDVPVEATAPTQITIQTTTGTPQTNSGFIDSWIELWQGTTKLRADDDGAHSGTNVLASFITAPIDAGFYFIRATSFAWMASNYTQTPTGSYLLTWNGVTTLQPIPTPTPEPTPTETETQTPSPEPTIEPTEQPSPEPTATDSITPTPTQIPEQTQEQPNYQRETTEMQLLETPQPILQPILPNLLETESETQEEIPVQPSLETPIVEPELSIEQLQEQINEEYIAENIIELQVPTALESIPGIAQVFAATEAILNVGSDMTEEEREESQSVVVAAIVLTQIAQMVNVRKIQ